MQYIRPDLMYTINRLSNYAFAPYAPAFKYIKKLVR